MLAHVSLALAAYTALASAQAGPNTVFANYPLQQTFSVNGTYTVLALDKDVVAGLVAPKKLIDIQPDPLLFPQGFPAGKHPVMVHGGYDGSIKQAGLEIPYLMMGRLEIPCVDQLNDGKTCFRKQLGQYLGGAQNQLFAGLIPSVASTLLVGATVQPGRFMPDGAPLKDLGNNQFGFEVQADIVENPFSGPGLAPPAFQFVLTKYARPPFHVSEAGFHYFINQVIIANNGLLCFNSVTFFNESFAQPFFGASEVDITPYPFKLNGVDQALSGSYNGSSYFANGEFVNFAPTTCESAVQAHGDLVGN